MIFARDHRLRGEAPNLNVGRGRRTLYEADEFVEIYKLEVIEIPTNVPVIRNDEHDEVYRTAAEKYEAVAKLIGNAKEIDFTLPPNVTIISNEDGLFGGVALWRFQS